MTRPFIGQGMPANESWFAEQIRDLRREITELRAARSLGASTVDGAGLASANFDGSLNPPAVGTQGWGLSGATGTAILGSILLRSGIIGNDALEHPTAFAAAHDDASNFALSTTVAGTPCSVSLAVPAGFSTALVLGMSDLTCFSTVAATATVITEINGVTTPFGNSTGLLANTQHAVSNSFARVLTGLSGGSITVATEVASNGANIPANGGTWANLAALAVFLR